MRSPEDGIVKSVSSYAREASGFARGRASFSRGKRLSRHYRGLHKSRQGASRARCPSNDAKSSSVIFARVIILCENECENVKAYAVSKYSLSLNSELPYFLSYARLNYTRLYLI